MISCVKYLIFLCKTIYREFYLPPYSPNLNLIERLWKIVKKKCLYSKYYSNLSLFKNGISNRLVKYRGFQKAVRISISGIAFFYLTYMLVLPSIFSILATISLISKTIITILLLKPLAFSMGMPFPMALASLAKHGKQLIPWAWGINGCASVISAVLATFLAIHFCFTTVIFWQ